MLTETLGRAAGPPPKYRYLAEKLSCARRELMHPHAGTELADLKRALMQCRLGVLDLTSHDMEGPARAWYMVIKRAVAQRDFGVLPTEPDDLRTLVMAIEELAEWAANRREDR